MVKTRSGTSSVRTYNTPQSSMTEVLHHQERNEVQSKTNPQNKKPSPPPKPEIEESNAVSSNSSKADIVSLGKRSIEANAKQERKNLELSNKEILGVLARKYGVPEKDVYALFQKNTEKTLSTVNRVQNFQLKILSKAAKSLPRTAKLLRTVVNVGWKVLKAPQALSTKIINGPLKYVTTPLEAVAFVGGPLSALFKLSVMAYAYAIQVWVLNGVVYYTVLFTRDEESIRLDLPYYGDTQLNLRNISGTGIGIPRLNMPRLGAPSYTSAVQSYIKFNIEFVRFFWNFLKKEAGTPEAGDIINQVKDLVAENTEEIIQNYVVRPFTQKTLALAEQVTTQIDEGLNNIGKKSPVSGLAVKGFKKAVGVVSGFVDTESLPQAIGFNGPSVVNNDNFLALPVGNNSAFVRNQ